ncbi:phosphotransferase [Acetobacter aceti NRIC 0242]|uniref:Phosphotransferase n=1 Tax=Acetobacter aceti NBRC 14818 TaxID=887700 RepID=A0AB33IMP4_ACEAC|nr:phosphotransferase [Acetobacter aceti]TCS31441.1 putative hotdog family 3-hydroxylacyl-ACP dehydratase [Acetobacter aceti NBRC 14818]BCK76819.1 phosphotransferase [Acetobacter aceti NBRC 14818]GAN56922.1 3-oxoacyl-(acyl carrier protein) reductase/phosphotransferase [Acetobacter aceti NBRC 14818]GBO81758.1 phosphotransferase [Acetobacter aceti NRIC 0242]
MLNRDAILGLIPHQGASCLLDECRSWTATTLEATTRRHLDPDCPLRHSGRLGSVTTSEIAMQAAALHGALTGGKGHAPGYLAALRSLNLHCDRLDDPRHGSLLIRVTQDCAMADGFIYGFTITAASGETLATGSGTVMFHATIETP